MTATRLRVRLASGDDMPILRRALAHAIEWRLKGLSTTPDEVISHTAHEYLLADWGREGDVAVVAEIGSRAVGAAWYRYWNEDRHSYGYVDARTPEIVVGVEPGYRGQGIGTALLEALGEAAREACVRRLSLSVEADNPARRLYERTGFAPHELVGTSWTMIKTLGPSAPRPARAST